MNACASMSENLRVLYVAITRAKEQFVTFASYKNVANAVERLASKIFDGEIYPTTAKHFQSDGDILLMTALMHKDGAKLRTLADVNVRTNVFADFDLAVYFDSDIEEIAVSSADVSASADEETVRAIADRLSFEYSGAELSRFSSKRSASELDEKDSGFKYFAKSKPAFLDSEGMTAAEKGSATHAFMQYADFEAAANDIESEIDRLCEKSFITSQQAVVLDRDKLKKFFDSDIAKRMLASDTVYRELKLSSFVPANELENTDRTELILVQGIADCIFEENGELVLVDYKTDFVKNKDELLNLYKKQLQFYKNAAQKALKKRVKQSLLYSFALSEECVYK